ncbi:hypothetical protein L6452_09385 [Arctium lappa]|uniref:Uncharacterized protein n=1 Tax=Arctium lappa TaxID=4217 RepID=A0ACB9DKR4_ARCLA|nr:hypothetical protein L6452_09385 [Arctium lappa]
MAFAFYEMEKHTVTKMTIMSLSYLYILASSRATIIGVNYGRLGNNLPSPSRSIELLQTMNAGQVKLYDADHEILQLLSTTKLKVTIMVANDEISAIASSQQLADQWVYERIFNHYPDTMIRFVLVGNEVLSYTTTDQDKQIMKDLVPAMARIWTSLTTEGINDIKIGTPFAMDILESTFPPSSGRFKPEIVHEIVPLLDFLSGTDSLFFIDVYPYFSWSENPMSIALDYALLNGNQTYTDPGSGLTYTNLLDQMLDSVFFAMAKLGYNNVMIGIAETGWPHEGELKEYGANRENAAVYNRNIVRKMTTFPPMGTPARPGVIIPTYIFSLYDENQKFGPESERHWGLLHPDGSPVYEVDLSGREHNISGSDIVGEQHYSYRFRTTYSVRSVGACGKAQKRSKAMESKFSIKIILLHWCLFFLTISSLLHLGDAVYGAAENNARPPSNGSLQELLEELWESEITRRYLEEKRYISEGALKRDQPACGGGGRGEAYTKSGSCTPPPSNPYNRGCSKYYRCRS